MTDLLRCPLELAAEGGNAARFTSIAKIRNRPLASLADNCRNLPGICLADVYSCQFLQNHPGQFRHASSHERFRKACLFGHLLEISGRNVAEQILTADLHSHLLAQLGVVKSADKIVKRSESHIALFGAVEQRKVLRRARHLSGVPTQQIVIPIKSAGSLPKRQSRRFRLEDRVSGDSRGNFKC